MSIPSNSDFNFSSFCMISLFYVNNTLYYIKIYGIYDSYKEKAEKGQLFNAYNFPVAKRCV